MPRAVRRGPGAIPALPPGPSQVSQFPELNWPGGAGTPEFPAGRHQQTCAQEAPAGHGYRGPGAPTAAWRIPTPDPAFGRAGAGATAATASVRPAPPAPRYRRG